MSQWLNELIQSKIVVFDGAMGTQLQERNFPAGECPERWNLTHPEVIREIHESYLKAGADIITTNTFGATAVRLEEFGLDDKVAEINHAAIQIAKEAVNNYGYGYVAASIGPTGKLIEPLGELSFDIAYEVYKEQVIAITEAGADLIIIETIGDINEMRAALLAATENSHLPVIASMSYQEDGRTFTGTDPQTAAVILERLGASVIAVNCSVGPEQLEEVVKTLVRSTNLPILVQPNAGLPKLVKGKTIYEGSPEKMAEYARKFVEYGANMVGSCCGSTPEYTKAIYEQVKDLTPILRNQEFGLRVASRVRTTTIDPFKGLPVIVGERINPTGRKKLSEELKQGKMETVRREAIEQTEAGAEILDVNVGVPTIDERKTMIQVIQSIQTLVDTPLMLDSTNPEVLDQALKLYPGKALVNSVNGEDASLDSILPLVKRYGAAVVGLTLDEKGIPKTAEERYQIAEKIVKKAAEYGIPKQDIIIDCLVLTASAQPEGIAETLKAITLVKERLQVPTILGVSNVSFGLPNRKAINPVFLSMALAAGLDAAIMNPLEEQMVQTMKIGAVLTNRDRHAEAYIEYAKEKMGANEEKVVKKTPKQKEAKDIYEALYQVVLAGDKERVVPLIEQGLKEGKDPMDLLNKGLIPGIEEVGRLFGNGTYFLPQLIQAGDTMTISFERLRPELAKQSDETIGTIVMATVKGDIHDIGKNIVSVLLSNHRFKVIDLGKNVPNEVVIQRAIEEKADIIGLSALMTTTMVRMKEVVEMIEKQNLPFKVIIGGAAVNEQYAKEIRAHGYAKDAVEAVEVAKALLKQRSVF
ncbi:homocysteine S-methyltransferase family protein [Tepidibacillus sp. LV47]|uniref:homocysteine S-methyltransferase family protein n=1 Tax=Tepidibacillus sp. LV47 TaxID=3398228 RepID=UPI003AAE059F